MAPFHMMWPFTEYKGGSEVSTCMSCLLTPDKMCPITSGTLIPSTPGWLIPSNLIKVFVFSCSLTVLSAKHFVTIVIQVTKQKIWTKNRVVVLKNPALLFLSINLFFQPDHISPNPLLYSQFLFLTFLTPTIHSSSSHFRKGQDSHIYDPVMAYQVSLRLGTCSPSY